MKAVILVAGVGSRLRPLTNNIPKALLPIGSDTTLGLMVAKLHRQGIDSFIIITGNMEDKIRHYLQTTFPQLEFTFIRNDRYETTNTGYSLMLAKPHLQGDSFIKLDGDVNFDEQILAQLIATPDDSCYVCVDKSDVDEEVIKAQLDDNGLVQRIGNTIPVETAAGESIGIEKISAQSAPALFAALEELMADEANHQKYYESAYDQIVQAGEPFRVVDITGLQWVEMDTLEDYHQAIDYFANAEISSSKN
jgi:choline kinase